MRHNTTIRGLIRKFGLLWGTLLFAWAAHAQAVTIDTVPVGNAGNAADTTGFGAVAYEYYIGTYEVTNTQYAAFLNAKAASDPLNLYHTGMGSDPRGGITRSGSDGSYAYAVKPNMGNKPVNYIEWFDALRFANWLNNGQGSSDTETGAYTLLGGTTYPSNSATVTRNEGAIWFLTSEDEWYKAAYHQPVASGGDFDNYWAYPTASNTAPAMASANAVGDINNAGPDKANYNLGADWNGQNGNVTTVGSAGPLSQSFYGTSDQAGNVWEWNEALVADPYRGLRGGSWTTLGFKLDAVFRGSYPVPNDASADISLAGFRVATLVPEPSTLVLAACGAIAGFILAGRGKRRVHGQ